jgi:hypothetical protein
MFLVVLSCFPVEFTDVSVDRAASSFRVGNQTTWGLFKILSRPHFSSCSILLRFLIISDLIFILFFIRIPPSSYVHKIPAVCILPQSTLTLYPPYPLYNRLVYYRDDTNSKFLQKRLYTILNYTASHARK